ncbi:hypothetical protein [Myxosarcina sp. GI1]|uniref:hypothetical protein n=1 Tax=Myxosarcina sp. GI1 TaxID=1541065 RepID=UPI0005604809|nr:hypothetical protein [Myxosarcina sp. GI1]
MPRKVTLALIWIGFSFYAFVFAPPQQPDTFALIADLATGNWGEINPLIIALFNIMGVLPAVYACMLLFDGRGQKFPAAPFVALSFGVGIFALLPYFVLRQPNPKWNGERSWLLKILDSRACGIILTLSAIFLLVLGFTQGDWSDFVRQWQTSRFIHVMSLDFCLLCVFFPLAVKDDLARRRIESNKIFWAISLTPLLGTLAYLCLRPSLSGNDNSAIGSQAIEQS